MSNNKIVSWVIKVGLLLVPILPLVVTRSLFFPFITGRNFIFRIIIEIIFVLWIWLIMADSEYKPKTSPIFWAFSGFTVVLFLATIFSISPYKSFWSSFERMEGFWAFWHYFLYFLILGSMFKSEKDWSRFWGVSIGVSIVMSLYAFFQFLGKLDVHQGEYRLDATMGNSTYLAIYLVFHIFLALFFILKSQNLWLRLALSLVVLSELFIVYRTATRGAILGLLGGLMIFFVINTVWSRGRMRKISLVILAFIIAVPLVFLAVKNTSFIKNSEVLSRFSSISLTEATTQSRFIIWRMAYEGWKDRPVLGWGPESFVYVFSKYYDPQLWRQEPWFDRAHNVFLDWLTSAGLVGLLAYLSLFVSAILVLYRLFKNKIFEVQSLAVFIGLLVAYFINNLFVFDNFTSYIIFFAILAYLHQFYKKDEKESSVVNNESLFLTARFIILGIVSIAVIFSLYFFNVKPILASGSIIDALSLVTYSRDGSRTRDLGEALKALKKGIEYNTFGTAEIREQLAQYASKINLDPATSNEEKKEFLGFALSETEKQVEMFPYDVRAKAFLSTLYGDAGDYANSILIAQDGLNVSSKRQHFYFLLGEAYFKAGEEDLAIETLKKAYNLAPEYPDAIYNYAIVLIFAGRPAEAEAIVKKHFGTEIIGEEKFVNAYAALGDFKKVTAVWEKLVERDPNDPEFRLGLASIYARTFRDKEAIYQLEKIIEINPNSRNQVDVFIEQIKEGKLKR